MAKQKQRDLPSASDFSPTIIHDGLSALLARIKAVEGNQQAIRTALQQHYFAKTQHHKKDPEQKRARNVCIALSEYELFDLKTNKLTPLGDEFRAIADAGALNERFATHILQNLHGKDLVEAAEAIRARGETPDKVKVNDELRLRGFEETTNSTNAGRMRDWLSLAGVIHGEDYAVDRSRFAKLAGIDLGDLEDWEQLTRSQQATALTLKHLSQTHGEALIEGSFVKGLCETSFGLSLPESGLRKKVLDPLEEQGWITSNRVGRAKIGKIGATKKLINVKFPLSREEDVQFGVPRDLRDKQNTPLPTIYKSLKSTNINIKGTALELLALRMCIDLGLSPVKYRLRSRQVTGQAEVDLIAEGVHLHFSRWLIQCKNYPTTAVDLTALAKEIGLCVLLRGHVVVVVTTGSFKKTVKEYAKTVAETTPLQVVLVDGTMIADYQARGAIALYDHFHKQARDVLTLKRRQVAEVLEVDGD